MGRLPLRRALALLVAWHSFTRVVLLWLSILIVPLYILNPRLDSLMSNGGDPEAFERASPQMMQQIMEERYKARQYRAEDLFA